MALIKCPECGKEISDKAVSCPNCGCPNSEFNKQKEPMPEEKPELFACVKCGKSIPKDSQKCQFCGYSYGIYGKTNDNSERYNTQNQNAGKSAPVPWNHGKEKSKIDLLGVLVLILGILSIVLGTVIIGIIPSILGLVLGAKALMKNKSSGIVIGGICCSAFGLLVSVIMIVAISSSGGESTQNVMNEVQTENATVEDVAGTEMESLVETVVETESESIVRPEQATEIYITDLLDEWGDYVGEWVTVSYPCGRTDDDDKTIQSEYDSDAGYYLRSYVDNYRDFEYGDYVTVTGLVEGDYASYIEIKNAHIDYYGSDAESDYIAKKAIWDERQHEIAISARDSFIESAASVTYDDLRRYPDTYKDKAITLKLKIKSVEPDGWIFQGDIIATIPGTSNEIAVYDARTVREPRFMDGDTITVYARGNGLAKIQIKDGKGLLSKVVDEYEIPSIEVIYTDNDNLDILGTSSDSSSEAAEAGKKAAEALNKILEAGE